MNDLLALRWACDQLVLARLDIVGGWYWHCPHDPEPMFASRADFDALYGRDA